MATPKTKPAAKSTPKKATKSVSKATSLEHKLVRATAALKKDYAKLQASLHKLRGDGAASFDALYELVGRILGGDPPLYLGGGYKTKEEFIAAELPGETLRSVQRNVLVAWCFSPEDEQQHGIAFLEEVALYVKELAGAAQAPPAIDLDKLRIVSQDKGGTTVRKKARDASIDDVRRARRALRKGGKTGRDASPLEAALRAALGKHKSLATVSVRAGAERASFGDVPVAELSTFVKALGAAKLPRVQAVKPATTRRKDAGRK